MSSSTQNGEPPFLRAIYIAISMTCTILLSFMLGSRARHLNCHRAFSMNVIRLIVAALYLFAIAFIVSSTILECSTLLSTFQTCRAAILICLVFYTGSKIVMYMFLIERAHALKAPYIRRIHDWTWLLGMFLVGTGFGATAVLAFLNPVAELSGVDGKCRIGLPLKVTIPLLIFDIVINLVLTGIFIHLITPLVRSKISQGSPGKWLPWIRKIFSRCTASSARPNSFVAGLSTFNGSIHREIENLLTKSLVGAFLMLLPTIANLSLLFHMKGRELGWLCLTICTLDVSWAVCVIHWLTVDPIEVEDKAAAKMSADLPNFNTGNHYLRP